MRILPCIAVTMAVGAFAAPAQQTPSVDDEVARLFAYARDYHNRLPSLECDESIDSQQVKNGKIKWEVKVEAVLSEVRDPKISDGFRDSYQFKTVNGKPPGKSFKIPYLVQGAFPNAIGFADESQKNCFDYKLSQEDGGATLSLELAAKPPSSNPACKDVFEDYRKIVLIDVASGAVKHVTRTMSPAAARKHHETPFASIDYAPQSLGDLTLWLPTHLESHDEKDEGRMQASFSNYHRFAAKVTILPDIKEVPPGGVGKP